MDFKKILEDKINIIIAEESAKRMSDLVEKLIDATPIDTGLLASSWEYSRTGENDYEIVNDAPYAKHVENRTGFVSEVLNNESNR